MRKASKKKDDSWDKIGSTIGRKLEKEFKGKKWKFCHHEHEGGGFGRFLFILAVLFILNAQGYLVGVSSWMLVLLVLGFTLMKF
jgi:hypothetical protein